MNIRNIHKNFELYIKNVELFINEFFTLNPTKDKPDVIKLIQDRDTLYEKYLANIDLGIYDPSVSEVGKKQFKESAPYLHERFAQLNDYIARQRLLYNKNPGEYGITELMLCVSNVVGEMESVIKANEKHMKTAASLIQRGEKVNDRDINGRTALFWPAFADEVIIDANQRADTCEAWVRFLLDKGADPNIKDKQGKTALYYYQIKNYEGVVTILKEAMEKSKQNQNPFNAFMNFFGQSTSPNPTGSNPPEQSSKKPK